AAVDAAQFVDVELDRVLLAIVPRRFARFDVNAVGWADGRAHEAGDTLDPAVLVAIEPMHTAIVRLVETAFLARLILATLFRVLQRLVEPAPADGPDQ